MAGLPLVVAGAEEAVGVGEAIVEVGVPVLERTVGAKKVLHTLTEFGKKAMGVIDDFNAVVSGVQNVQTIIDGIKPKHSEIHPAHNPTGESPIVSPVPLSDHEKHAKLQSPQHAEAQHPAVSPSHQPDHQKPTHATPPASHHHVESQHSSGEPIAFGSTGPAVSEIQRELGVRVDGIDGPQTTAALDAFKREHGLRPDGIAGPTTRTELAAEPMVREGSQGDAVRRIQERLGVRVDGLDGAQTTAAVKAFQQSHGLAVDGIVGIHTWHALDAAARARTSDDIKACTSDEPKARNADEATLHIRYGTDERAVRSGFQQSGKIMSVVDDIVTQSAGRSLVIYKLSELTADAANAAAVTNLLVPGQEVKISVDHEGIHVTNHERDRQLDRANPGR